MRNELDYKQSQQLERCNDQLMIGRLRENDPLIETSTGLIRYFVTPLCDDFLPVLEMSEIFCKQDVGYGGVDSREDWKALGLEYDYTEENIDRKVDLLWEYLDEKLIVFIPTFVEDSQKQLHKNFYVFDLFPDISIGNKKINYVHFTSVPIVNMPAGRFEKELRDGQLFELPEYRAGVHPAPEMIFCQDYAYIVKPEVNEDVFVPHKQFGISWKCVNYDALQKVEYKKIPDYQNYVVNVNELICFVEDSLRNTIQIQNAIQEEDELEEQNVISEVLIEEVEVVDKSRNLKEVEFLNSLQKLTLNNGLRYEFNDLVNFHTSVKTNPLTILAGMSGTGKTQLAYNYARMLNLYEASEELLFMPISPSYTEPSDVLGYLNAMTHEYVPSESGLVPFLIHAQQHQDRMHMVIFDEMNLSQVEYWFSPFISILEKDVDDRLLNLYESHAKCENSDLFPSQVSIGKNVIFIGTVNLDETTKEFSDRLLDRTFMISLQKGNFTSFYKAYEENSNKLNKVDIEENKCRSTQEFMSWCKGGNVYLDIFKNHEKELEFLDELDVLIQKYIPDGGISYRVLRNIGNYLKNVPLLDNGDMIISRKEVFDVIVKETILTKIRGTETQLHNLIGESNGDYSEIVSLLNKYQEVSDFTMVRATVLKKAEELRIHGYAH